MGTLLSSGYREQLKQIHALRPWGDEGHTWAAHVRALAESIGAVSILDYGCGRGTLKEALPDLDVREYDPGIPGKDEEPFPADLIVLTDVLEHVEPSYMDATLTHIRDLSKKGAFLVIWCKPARAVLPDGRNAHLSVYPPAWWTQKLKVLGGKQDVTVNRGREVVVAITF